MNLSIIALLGLAFLGNQAFVPPVFAYADCDGHYDLSSKFHGKWSERNVDIELHDLENRVFLLRRLGDQGYEIIHAESGTVIERSLKNIPPFDFTKEGITYLGPTQYYSREGNMFFPLNANMGKPIDLEQADRIQQQFAKQLYDSFRTCGDQKINAAPKRLSSGGTVYYIPYYTRVRDDQFPVNVGGDCGFVAASIVLHYWDMSANGHIIAPQFKDALGNLNSTSSYLPEVNIKDKLVEYNGGEKSSWASPVRDAMVSYCDDHNVSHDVWWGLGKYTVNSSLDIELLSGRPVIVFGALPDYPNSNLITHAVTAYGIHNFGSYGYYIVNYGWGSDATEIELGFGFVGSITTFKALSWPSC